MINFDQEKKGTFMNQAAVFFESISSERNRSGQGVQRELTSNDVPAEILALLGQAKVTTKK